MKNYTRKLIRDIKAAAQIGHIESLWVAVDSLAKTREVKGNHPLTESFLNQVILPVAQALSGQRVSKAALQPLLTHPKTAIRAAAGAALALRFLKDTNGTALKDLQTLSKEPRKEVREAVVIVCHQAAPDYPEKLKALIDAWLKDPSARLQGIAIRLLPDLPADQAMQNFQQLSDVDLPKDPEIRSALEKTISQLGRTGLAREAIAILRLWAARPDTFYWVITRSLAKGWAAGHAQAAMEILTVLAKEYGAKKKIRNALQAFTHNGASAMVRETIQNWKTSDHPNLKDAGEDAYNKLIQPSE